MKKCTINICLLAFMSLFYSCQKDKLISSKELLSEIDKLKVENISYELQTDSLGEILDTISKTIIKKNNDGVKVYEEKKVYKGENFYDIKNYYLKGNNLFYSKTVSSELGIISIFETFLNKDKIVKAFTVNYLDNKILDTIKIDYKYFYKKNFLKKLVVSIEDDTVSKPKITISYNDFEKPYLEINEINDEIELKTLYEYNKDILVKKVIKNIKANSINEFFYNKEGFLESEILLVKGVNDFDTIRKVKYLNNKNGEILEKVIYNVDENKILYFKYDK